MPDVCHGRGAQKVDTDNNLKCDPIGTPVVDVSNTASCKNHMTSQTLIVVTKSQLRFPASQKHVAPNRHPSSAIPRSGLLFLAQALVADGGPQIEQLRIMSPSDVCFGSFFHTVAPNELANIYRAKFKI